MDFAFPLDHRVKMEETDKQILGYGQKSEKSVEHEGYGYIDYSWSTWNGAHNEPRGIGNQWKNRDYPGDWVVKICWDAEKSFGDLR